MTDRERVRALQRFGYAEPEGAFLSLAALHSGYFLRRQYTRFLGAKDSGKVNQLGRKAPCQEGRQDFDLASELTALSPLRAAVLRGSGTGREPAPPRAIFARHQEQDHGFGFRADASRVHVSRYRARETQLLP